MSLVYNYYCGVLMLILYFPHFFYILQLKFCREKISICINLLIYLLIPVCWTHGHLFFSVGCNPLFYFVAQVVPALTIGCSLRLASKPFDKPLSSLKPFLTLAPLNVQAHLIFSLLHPEISPFFKES